MRFGFLDKSIKLPVFVIDGHRKDDILCWIRYILSTEYCYDHTELCCCDRHLHCGPLREVNGFQYATCGETLSHPPCRWFL